MILLLKLTTSANKELWNYSRYLPCFQDRWLDDIFERHILVTNILK
jgi:hypothetical protein